jgi:uncharacterized protein
MNTHSPRQSLALALHALFVALGCGFACSRVSSAAPLKTADFEFVSGGRILSGRIDQPGEGKARDLIIFVHGSGATDIRRGNTYFDLRSRFAELGIASMTWDKPGCGRSEGEFDSNQSIEASAQEVVDAIAYARRVKVPGANQAGIWATSRGCWVAPLALARDPTLRFWISVSGTPAEDNKYYLMSANLPLEGRAPAETKRLMAEWRRGREIFIQGGSYDSYLRATETLRKDPAVFYLAGDLTGTKADYEAEQAAYLKAPERLPLDPETLSLVRVPNLDRTLRGLSIDVLALFGERDTNSDWRKARALYEATIGRNPNASLTVRTFPDCNHSINISSTGSVREVEGTPLDAGMKCPGYYEVQIEWLRKYVVRE